jgi:hypothetical protein
MDWPVNEGISFHDLIIFAGAWFVTVIYTTEHCEPQRDTPEYSPPYF